MESPDLSGSSGSRSIERASVLRDESVSMEFASSTHCAMSSVLKKVFFRLKSKVATRIRSRRSSIVDESDREEVMDSGDSAYVHWVDPLEYYLTPIYDESPKEQDRNITSKDSFEEQRALE
ncbi:hypothetical protein BSKO_07783 [Bryopsis sp. KO-2023]|nr:hypothetical protein BSKO_07783 [Bryopsis sp. KO-2023]